MVAFLDYLPRGNTLSDESWQRRHRFLQGLLLAHLPALLTFGLLRGQPLEWVLEALALPGGCLLVSRVLRTRRLSSLAVTAGLVACSASLVLLSDGAIEAHFHFFVMIGFIALYQDWVPFLVNVLFTVVSHGIGSWFVPGRVFAHVEGQQHPWTWSLVHGVAVLAACAGVIVFWRTTEDEQRRSGALRAQLTESNRRRFTADLLVNLARRNQNLIYRQLDLLNRLEEHERDAESLSHLFQLDHLATRIRRNAESLLVLSGEEPARKWGRAVLLVDVVRAAIAEIEELDRVDFAVDESLAVSGRAVADCTHLLAELVENAVHFSPPGLSVMIRTRAYLPQPGAQVLTVEDWGVGMSPGDLLDANDILSNPRDVDLATSQRLGLHVVGRLAQRYKIAVSLEATPGGGVTAVMVLPAPLFVVADGAAGTDPAPRPGGRRPVTTPLPPGTLAGRTGTGAAAGSNGRANGHANGKGANGSAPVRSAPVPSAPVDDTAVLPAVERPAVERPAVERPAVERPAVDRPAVDRPAVDRPEAEAVRAEPRNPWATTPPPTAFSGDRTEAPPAEAPAGTPRADRAAETRWPDRLPAPRTDDPDWRSWWTLPARTGDRPDPLSDPLSDPLDELAELGALGDLSARDDLATLGDRSDQSDRTDLAGDLAARDDFADLAAGPGAGLLRRTPQASLADELRRRDRPAVPQQSSASRDPIRASSALSRFQATQRAGRAAPDPEDQP